jgi:hypothetical protein
MIFLIFKCLLRKFGLIGVIIYSIFLISQLKRPVTQYHHYIIREKKDLDSLLFNHLVSNIISKNHLNINYHMNLINNFILFFKL